MAPFLFGNIHQGDEGLSVHPTGKQFAAMHTHEANFM